MFKTFPEFSKLTLADKDEYTRLIARFPPSAHTTFTSLMGWWSAAGEVYVSKLNNNLVIQYWFEGDESNSGLSLVGLDDIDESLCAIFDYLSSIDQPVRLVNVPEFTISSIHYPDLFQCTEQRKFHEYIVAATSFYPLENLGVFRRKKLQRSFKRIGGRHAYIKNLDLSKRQNKELLIEKAEAWWNKNLNNYGKLEKRAFYRLVDNAKVLDVENACLFVDDELYGFCIYIQTCDKRYINIEHVKATHDNALGYELMGYLFAKWFTELGFIYGNLNSDAGILRLRMFMLTLGPTNFLRKYIIRPR